MFIRYRATVATPLVALGALVVGMGPVVGADMGTEQIPLPVNEGWRLVTDQVMGGVSQARLSQRVEDGREAFCLEGEVSTANNGGFVQMAIELGRDQGATVAAYDGLRINVLGNGETYNVHLRTSDLWLPWQSFRTSFQASPSWHTVDLPFAAFERYRTTVSLRVERLRRVGLVAIGRPFSAQLCVSDILLYRETR